MIPERRETDVCFGALSRLQSRERDSKQREHCGLPELRRQRLKFRVAGVARICRAKYQREGSYGEKGLHISA